MPQVSEAVRRETLWVAAWTVGLTLVMHLVFALIGKWGTDVLLGSVLGCAAAVGCFFWLGMTVQKAVGKPEREAKRILQTSMLLRLLVQGAALAAGFGVSWLNGWAVLVPLLCPQIAVRLRPLWKSGMTASPEAVEASKAARDAEIADEDDPEKGGEALD
ncbi:MAG: ATP synthase subunit I [Clostridia bacterium]|nr:ATP synthase subunit I [Clostridia bacterium]